MIGSLISAGASLIGGLIGSNNEKKARQQAEAQALRQEQLQREFAQNSIQWRVQDAKAAGLHPLAALGAQTQSYSPISVGYQPGSAMPNAVAQMGQDIGRAVSARGTQQERAYQATTQALSLRRMELENQVLENQVNASRLAVMRQAGGIPATPSQGGRRMIDGQGDLVEVSPLEITASRPGVPHQEPAPVNEVGFTRTAAGTFAPVQSDDAKQRLEEDLLGTLAWNIRNRLGPMLGPALSPTWSPPPDPEGERGGWIYDLWDGYRWVPSRYQGDRPAAPPRRARGSNQRRY